MSMNGECKRQGSIFLVLQSKRSSSKCAELHTVAASNNRDHSTRSLYYCLFAPHIILCCSSHTSRSWRIAVSAQRQLRVCNNIPSILQWTSCEGCTRHNLHIQVLAPLCYDWKTQAKSVRSFTLWQQATIEITCQAHSLSACLCHIYMGVVLHAHPIHGKLYIQNNTNREVATLAARLG